MDMAVTSLFKHKIRFELRGHDRDWGDPLTPSKGYRYSSNWIESYVYMVDDYVRATNAYYEEQVRLSNQEVEENEPLAPPIETYRQYCCVVCLEAKPNILYLDCMHIAICDSCDRLKKTGRKNCDMCRAEISKRVKI